MKLKILFSLLLFSTLFQADQIKSNIYDNKAQCVSELIQEGGLKLYTRRDIKKLCSCAIENDDGKISVDDLGKKCADVVFNTPENNKDYKNNYEDTNRIQISVKGRKKIVNDSNECTIFYNDNGMGFNRAMSICSCYYDDSTNNRFSNNFSMVSRYCQNNNPISKFTRQPTQAEYDYQLRMLESLQRNNQRQYRRKPSFGEKFNNRLENRMIDNMTDELYRDDLGYD